jgi:Fe-Mn family superoxide dismutase
MTFSFIRNVLNEGRPHRLEIKDLPYGLTKLDPALSKETLEYHFGRLAKTYAERYNANEGDPVFNEAGVFLHNILFQQYQTPKSSNKPTSGILEFIETHFKTFDKFKEEFAKTAMAIQGSGWVYLAQDGKIKTIKNHEIKRDIVLLIDWWEHAWALDYQADKKKYLENQWKIINWNHINVRNDM